MRVEVWGIRTAPRRLAVLLCAGLGALVSAACGTSPDDETILVLAAASLTDVLSDIADEFESANPRIEVESSFAGSNSIVVQIEQGAPADVVALADVASMDALVAGSHVDGADVSVFATNRMVLVTPVDDPGDVDALDDLADPARAVGVCADAVPCGSLTAELLDRAGVVAAPDTREPDVRSLVGKLVSGELDAGLVYATDARAFAGDLREVPVGVDVTTDYPVAVVGPAGDDDAARRFVDFVRSPAGTDILVEAGFGLP